MLAENPDSALQRINSGNPEHRSDAVDQVVREVAAMTIEFARNPDNQTESGSQKFFQGMMECLRHLPGHDSTPEALQQYGPIMHSAFVKAISGHGEKAIKSGVEAVLTVMDQAVADNREAGRSAHGSLSAPVVTKNGVKVDKRKLANLRQLDFSDKHARYALVQADNDLKLAADFLLNSKPEDVHNAAIANTAAGKN